MIFDLFEDGVSFKPLQTAAWAGENGTNVGTVGSQKDTWWQSTHYEEKEL